MSKDSKRTIRRLMPDDMDTYVDIYLNAYPAGKDISKECYDKYYNRNMQSLLEYEHVNFFGLFEDDELISIMKLIDFDINLFGKMNKATGLMSLAVHPLHKKKGVARDMVKFFEDYTVSSGGLCSMLLPFRIEYYRKMGYGYGTKLDEYRIPTLQLPSCKDISNLRLIKKDEIDKFQNIVDQMSKLQQQFFNAAEIQAFFGNERNFNQFSIDQMRIHANKTLTAQQKATELAKLIDQLPPTLADGVRVSMQFAELQQLTQEIKEKGGSAQELRNMRESLLGVEAADRLEKVDQEEAVWQNRVNNYLSQRDQILKSDVDDASKQRALNQLRNNSFATKEELLRAQTYEMMHDRKKS